MSISDEPVKPTLKSGEVGVDHATLESFVLVLTVIEDIMHDKQLNKSA